MKLRIAINAKRIDGPYGGGNQFLKALEKYLVAQGHELFRKLIPGLDVVLIAIANDNARINAFRSQEIERYLLVFPNTIVVHRVNTCDEQRGSDLGNNSTIMKINRLTDHTVFVSEFLKQVFVGHGWSQDKPNSVIHNAADQSIFNTTEKATWEPGQKMKVVTHHWSSNYLKGFDIYERLDQLLGTEPYSNLFEFTVIGNVPLGLEFKNSKRLAPMHGPELAEELKSRHLYLSAARHEAGGNHYIEAMACGLPVLYLKSGSLPEYCVDYGIGFDLVDFEKRLIEARDTYKMLSDRVLEYKYSAEDAAQRYEKIFIRMVNDGDSTISSTSRFARYRWWIGYNIPKMIRYVMRAIK
ncbi:MAG: glycosyltransferase [Candidatus Alcyoniella australis]|nr:glycosyltransferase [Candidatus Alcyoniella australis]